LTSYVARQGRALGEFATFNAWCEVHGPAWRSWPSDPGAPDPDRVAFHGWVQFHLDRQLARASRAIGLITDVPVGFASDGYDAWRWREYTAPGMRVGAPPDEFFRDGQDWGLPPLNPWKLSDAHWAPFIDAVRGAGRHAAGNRLDHVMGLFRLFWIPDGMTAAQGAYVRYPAGVLLRLLAGESRRAGRRRGRRLHATREGAAEDGAGVDGGRPRRAREAERPRHDRRVPELAPRPACDARRDRARRRGAAHRGGDEGGGPVRDFAPVGNGRVLAYVIGENLEYVRGTNVVRTAETRYAALGSEITTIDEDPPPLGGATRAVIVDRIPDLADREAVSDLYARSVLVLALHQETSGAFIAEPGDDVLIAHALDICGERGASEAFFEWALSSRSVDA